MMISEINIVTSKKLNFWYQQLVLNGSLWWHFTSENTIVDIKNLIVEIKNVIVDINNSYPGNE